MKVLPIRNFLSLQSLPNELDFLSTSRTSMAWKGPPILALVIGINKYTTQPCLQAAVGDADTFEDFLKRRLSVPDSNIISLRDEKASRASIISAFESLRDNTKYKKNEAAIIIYYAGHGARADKPEEWQDWATSDKHIELLCPSDVCCPIISANGEEDIVAGIPDRTISVLLNHISDVKGNNITLILDCCSSAGINRGAAIDLEEPEEEEYLIRRISNPPPVKSNIDKKILSHGSRGGDIANGFCGKFHASHVLLAACGRDQVAREYQNKGIFTASLMKAFKENDINTLTYTSLIDRLKMPLKLPQTPHCEGQGVYRQLFNNHAPGADSSFILTKRAKSSEGTPIILEAGAAQGITVGSRMAVHASNLRTTSTSNPCYGYLTVTSVGPSTSVLEVPLDTEFRAFQPPAHSFQVYCLLEYRALQNIALYCKDKLWLETVFPLEQQTQLGITIVDDVQSCDLELTVIDKNVYFYDHCVLVTPYIGPRICHTIDIGEISAIQEVVKSSSHFYYHLTRPGGDNFPDVWMELKLLEEELSEDFDRDFTPIGENLIAKEPATVVVDEHACLGMTIYNQSDLSLYPHLFYFDPTDLTIIEWYKPPFGAGPGRLTTRVDAPLPPKSKLTIGYGAGGVAPWQFMFREGDKRDVGFFKLFLSTRPTQFSNILQDSPFDIGTARASGLRPSDVPDTEGWGTKLATVIQVDS